MPAGAQVNRVTPVAAASAPGTSGIASARCCRAATTDTASCRCVARSHSHGVTGTAAEHLPLRDYCAAAGWTEVAEYADETSATDPAAG